MNGDDLRTVFQIFTVIAAGVIAIVVLIYLIVPIGRGVAWVIRSIFEFLFGVIGDLFRFVGAMLTGLFFVPLILANVLIGRWSAATHYGRSLQGECRTGLACLYRMLIGRPLKLVGMGNVVEGIEQRVPQAMAAAPGADKPSRKTGQFDGYQIVGSLAGGGSGGKLYVANPDAIKRAGFERAGQYGVVQVVIKSFSLGDGSSLPQIVRESRALEAAKKMGLVLDHAMTNERFYYVMRYVPGQSLSLVMQQLHAAAGNMGLGQQGLRSALTYGSDLLRTLDAYHRGGLWHKDVKPDNIIVDAEHAHLVDFGLLTHLSSSMTLTTHGTEYFRDPEMVRMSLRGVKVHEVDGAKFDIFAAGAVLYAMIENSFPAHGALSQVTKPCPDALRWIIRRAMTEYDKRYASTAQMLLDLETVRQAADPFAVTPAMLPSMREGMDDVPVQPVIDPFVGQAAAAGARASVQEFEVPPGYPRPTGEKAVPLYKMSYREGCSISAIKAMYPHYTDDNIRGVIREQRKYGNFLKISADGERLEKDPAGPRVDFPYPNAVRAAGIGVGVAGVGRPRIRVVNWWTGRHEVDHGIGQDAPTSAYPHAGAARTPWPPKAEEVGRYAQHVAAGAMGSAGEALRRAGDALRKSGVSVRVVGPAIVRPEDQAAGHAAGQAVGHAIGHGAGRGVGGPAHEQLARARARMEERRRRAQDRLQRRGPTRADFKTAPNRGVGIAVIAMVGLIVWISNSSPNRSGSTLRERTLDWTSASGTVRPELMVPEVPGVPGVPMIASVQSAQSDAIRTLEGERDRLLADMGNHSKSGAKGLKRAIASIDAQLAQMRSLHAAPELTVTSEFAGTGEPMALDAQSPATIEQAFIEAWGGGDGRVLVVVDLPRPLSEQQQQAITAVLMRLAQDGVRLVGDYPHNPAEGEEAAAQLDAVARLLSARGIEPLGSEKARENVSKWLVNERELDAALWISPSKSALATTKVQSDGKVSVSEGELSLAFTVVAPETAKLDASRRDHVTDVVKQVAERLSGEAGD